MFFFALFSGVSEAGIKEFFQGLFLDGDIKTNIVLFYIRLPRIIIAILSGACLASSGVLMQAVLNNPLADPGAVGISSGASLAISLVFFVFPGAISFSPVICFIGSVLVSFLILGISWNAGMNSIHIILAGIAVNSVIGGINSFLQLLFSDRLQFALMWMNGSLSGKSWNTVFSLFPYAVVGLILSFVAIKYANIIVLGDETAKSLGLNVGCTRLLLSILASYLAAITVANVGIIGFIGLVVPHTIRILSGGEHRKLMPMSMLLGGFLLLLADTIGRSIVDFMEIPVGTVMTILGGIFFIYLIYRNGRNYREL